MLGKCTSETQICAHKGIGLQLRGSRPVSHPLIEPYYWAQRRQSHHLKLILSCRPATCCSSVLRSTAAVGRQQLMTVRAKGYLDLVHSVLDSGGGQNRDQCLGTLPPNLRERLENEFMDCSLSCAGFRNRCSHRSLDSSSHVRPASPSLCELSFPVRHLHLPPSPKARSASEGRVRTPISLTPS